MRSKASPLSGACLTHGFELTRIQPNDTEIKLLLDNLSDQFLGNKSGIDPTGSFGDISRSLESATTTKCQTNDLNPLMVGTHENPLHTLVLQKMVNDLRLCNNQPTKRLPTSPHPCSHDDV